MKMAKPRTDVEGWGRMHPRRRLKYLRHNSDRCVRMVGHMGGTGAPHWKFVALLTIPQWSPLWRGENHNPPEARTLRCAYLGVQHIDGVSNGWHVSECDGGLIVFSTPR